jgi:hypothetical protein
MGFGVERIKKNRFTNPSSIGRKISKVLVSDVMIGVRKPIPPLCVYEFPTTCNFVYDKKITSVKFEFSKHLNIFLRD